MARVYKYSAHNVNGIVYTGYKWEVAEFIGCTSDEISEAERWHRAIHGLTITRELTDEPYKNSCKRRNRNTPDPEKIPTTIEYLKKHLEEYGNTVLGTMKESKVKEHLDTLKQETGIKTKYKVMVDSADRKQYFIIEKL